jgi:hypothetical protein
MLTRVDLHLHASVERKRIQEVVAYGASAAILTRIAIPGTASISARDVSSRCSSRNDGNRLAITKAPCVGAGRLQRVVERRVMPRNPDVLTFCRQADIAMFGSWSELIEELQIPIEHLDALEPAEAALVVLDDDVRATLRHRRVVDAHGIAAVADGCRAEVTTRDHGAFREIEDDQFRPPLPQTENRDVPIVVAQVSLAASENDLRVLIEDMQNLVRSIFECISADELVGSRERPEESPGIPVRPDRSGWLMNPPNQLECRSIEHRRRICEQQRDEGSVGIPGLIARVGMPQIIDACVEGRLICNSQQPRSELGFCHLLKVCWYGCVGRRSGRQRLGNRRVALRDREGLWCRLFFDGTSSAAACHETTSTQRCNPIREKSAHEGPQSNRRAGSETAMPMMMPTQYNSRATTSVPKRTLSIALAVFAATISVGCGGEDTQEDLRIYHSPYRDVDWANDLRLKGQHHDHIGLNTQVISAYDAAGYHALALNEYSGAPALSYALDHRLWPVESFLDAQYLQTLTSIEIWFPSAEEVGLTGTHVDSPFLATYIERWDPSRGARQPWHYTSVAELYEVIRAGGGIPILAHPWDPEDDPAELRGAAGMEIYSAYAEAQKSLGNPDFTSRDRNALLRERWDRALAVDQTILGIAVNDHYGPLPAQPVSNDIRDSGKVLVLSKANSLQAYREAFASGALLAVQDRGQTKDGYPTVRGITVSESSVAIDSDGSVRWIANGAVISESATLTYTTLRSGTRYLRAEVYNQAGSVVYTQAFWVRPFGDADGDSSVDADDEQVCARVRNGTETDPDRVSACNAPAPTP